jgi:hypothetical protein
VNRRKETTELGLVLFYLALARLAEDLFRFLCAVVLTTAVTAAVCTLLPGHINGWIVLLAGIGVWFASKIARQSKRPRDGGTPTGTVEDL